MQRYWDNIHACMHTYMHTQTTIPWCTTYVSQLVQTYSAIEIAYIRTYRHTYIHAQILIPWCTTYVSPAWANMQRYWDGIHTCIHTCTNIDTLMHNLRFSSLSKHEITYIYTYIHTYMHTQTTIPWYTTYVSPASANMQRYWGGMQVVRPLHYLLVALCMYVCMHVCMYVLRWHASREAFTLSPCRPVYACMYVCVCVCMHLDSK